MAEQNEQMLSFSERCGQFLTQHRKPIVIILGMICAVVAIALIASSLTSRAAKNASVATEAIISEWTDLRDKNTEDTAVKEDALVEKLEKQAAANGRTYAGFRAYTTLGEIYVLRKDWEKRCRKLIPPVLPILMRQPAPMSYNNTTKHWNCMPCRRLTTTFR